MQTDINSWLDPLFDAAITRPGIDLWAVMEEATLPLPQAAASTVAERLGGWPEVAYLMLLVDWLKFGQLLRHELGWDNSYPEHPLRGRASQFPHRAAPRNT